MTGKMFQIVTDECDQGRYYTASEIADSRVLDEMGLAKYVREVGYVVFDRTVKQLGMTFTMKQAEALAAEGMSN